jgi:hypothetical protein
MIATVNYTELEGRIPDWHQRFLSLVPAIRRVAKFRLRYVSDSRRQELIDEIVGICCAFYARLAERGQEERAYFTTLVRFAAAHLGHGRELGSRINVRDVLGRYCQQRNQLRVERLDEFDEAEEKWKEVLIEDKRATPADLAASRIDFAAWLETMSTVRRQLAEFLSMGETTRDAARRFALSPGRVSQIRREFQASWNAFQGQPAAAGAA